MGYNMFQFLASGPLFTYTPSSLLVMSQAQRVVWCVLYREVISFYCLHCHNGINPNTIPWNWCSTLLGEMHSVQRALVQTCTTCADNISSCTISNTIHSACMLKIFDPSPPALLEETKHFMYNAITPDDWNLVDFMSINVPCT